MSEMSQAEIASALFDECVKLRNENTDQVAEIKRLREALAESVKLQSHYASILNGYDGGRRMQFGSAEEWLDRLSAVRSKEGGAA